MARADSLTFRDTRVRAELRGLFALSGPLLLTHLGSMLLGVVDTAVVGRVGEVPLAAVGLGNSLTFTVSVLGFGWMLALDPMISQAVGAHERGRARSLLYQGFYVACAAAVPLGAFVVALGENLERFGIAAPIAAQVRPYLYVRLLGLVPFLWLAATRSFLQAHHRTRPLVIGVVLANAINLPLDWLLVFGDEGLRPLGIDGLGVPAFGVTGAAWATVAANVVQLAVAMLALPALWGNHRRRYPLERVLAIKMLRLGTPIGLTLLAEVGSFAIVAVMMGNLGARALSSHNVALMWIAMTFQLALALGAAASVRVGNAIGRGDSSAAALAGRLAIGCGAAAMMIGAAAFWSIPRPLAALLTDQPPVIDAAVALLAVAACFQLSDGVQAVAAGALRGAGDTRWPLVANLVGHYAIGIPVGAGLTFAAGLGAVGLWWGLSAGLTFVAVTLTARFWILGRGPIHRV